MFVNGNRSLIRVGSYSDPGKKRFSLNFIFTNSTRPCGLILNPSLLSHFHFSGTFSPVIRPPDRSRSATLSAAGQRPYLKLYREINYHFKLVHVYPMNRSCISSILFLTSTFRRAIPDLNCHGVSVQPCRVFSP